MTPVKTTMIILIIHILIYIVAFCYLRFAKLNEAAVEEMQAELEEKAEKLRSNDGETRFINSRAFAKDSKKWEVFEIFLGIAFMDLIAAILLFPLSIGAAFVCLAAAFVLPISMLLVIVASRRVTLVMIGAIVMLGIGVYVYIHMSPVTVFGYDYEDFTLIGPIAMIVFGLILLAQKKKR